MKLYILHEAGSWQVLRPKDTNTRKMSLLKQPKDRDRFMRNMKLK